MNLMTTTLQKMTDMLIATDNKLKDFGAEPYKTKKATAKEQRERIKNLTPGELYQMIQEHGVEGVDDWIRRYGGKYGMV